MLQHSCKNTALCLDFPQHKIVINFHAITEVPQVTLRYAGRGGGRMTHRRRGPEGEWNRALRNAGTAKW